jgi:hypothetical protein
VDIDEMQTVRRLIVVLHTDISGQTMGFIVQTHVDGIIDFLLKIGLLGMAKTTQKE